MGGEFGVRFWHHLFLWFFVTFIIIHIYLAFYHDYIEGRGTVSSIIGGWKFDREKSENEPIKTLVLGLGNVLMGDEGIGVYVVREVEKHTLPANVECLDGGTGGITLLAPLENADRIIIIDAASDGNPLAPSPAQRHSSLAITRVHSRRTISA